MSTGEWLSAHWWEVVEALWPLFLVLLGGLVSGGAWATAMVIYLRRIADDGRRTWLLVLHHKHSPVDQETGEGGEVLFDHTAMTPSSDAFPGLQ